MEEVHYETIQVGGILFCDLEDCFLHLIESYWFRQNLILLISNQGRDELCYFLNIFMSILPWITHNIQEVLIQSGFDFVSGLHPFSPCILGHKNIILNYVLDNWVVKKICVSLSFLQPSIPGFLTP